MARLQISDAELARKILELVQAGVRQEFASLLEATGSSGGSSTAAWVNPMNGIGQIIRGGTGGAPVRVAAGTPGQLLTVNGSSVPVFTTPAIASTEDVQDAIASALTDSASIDFTYDDALNTITATVILEWLQDTVAAMLTGGTHTNITTTYQDAGGVIDLASSAAIAELDDVPDVNAPTPSDNDVLTWDSTPGEWVPKPVVAVSGRYQMYVLSPDGFGGFEFVTDLAGNLVTTLEDLE